MNRRDKKQYHDKMAQYMAETDSSPADIPDPDDIPGDDISQGPQDMVGALSTADENKKIGKELQKKQSHTKRSQK